MNLAPIALFTYNRPWHTQQTVEALQKNELADASELIVFSDGPKSEADEQNVLSVRRFLKTITGFKKLTIFDKDINRGLSKSIIAGVTEVINRYGRIIVLEDDMITSPYFLRFMNEALEFYEHEDKIISIHGYIYPVITSLPETFFLKGADCWGWATWKRGWELFDHDGQKLLDELRSRKLTRQFDFDDSYAYTKMLEDQVSGENNSWAIRWYASAFLKDKLTLYPGKSLIFNTGIDDSGTHCGTSDLYHTVIAHEPIIIDNIPIEENPSALKAFRIYFHSFKPSLAQIAADKISKIMSR